MVWILLLVHITLHGMIGGLLKHFPKAVCGIIFICKNIFECQKRKLFFLSPSQCICHSHAHHEHKVQFKLRERDFFVVWRLGGLPVSVFSADPKMQSAWNHHLSRPQSAIRTEMQSFFSSLIVSPCLRPQGAQIFRSYSVDSWTAGCSWPRQLKSPSKAHSQVEDIGPTADL